MAVIIFERVGIQTNKTHIANRKSKIVTPENFLVHIKTRPQAIMIPQQANIRYP